MNLLWTSLLYFGVGFLEWWISLRRLKAVVNNERALLFTLVFVENFLALVVLISFCRTGNWILATVYSVGGSLGAISVLKKESTADFCSEKGQAPFGTCPNQTTSTRPSTGVVASVPRA